MSFPRFGDHRVEMIQTSPFTSPKIATLSIAWVVRDAVERYLEPEATLFKQENP